MKRQKLSGFVVVYFMPGPPGCCDGPEYRDEPNLDFSQLQTRIDHLRDMGYIVRWERCSPVLKSTIYDPDRTAHLVERLRG